MKKLSMYFLLELSNAGSKRNRTINTRECGLGTIPLKLGASLFQ